MSSRDKDGYLNIEDYGLIGNMHTCAMVGTDGALDYMCWPDFDSPSIFCRILDCDKGGFFGLRPKELSCTQKQLYVPSTNILQTRFLREEGVSTLVDFFPRPKEAGPLDSKGNPSNLKKWLIRRVQCVRGEEDFLVEIFPAFNYGRDPHEITIRDADSGTPTVVFTSASLSFKVDIVIDSEDGHTTCPTVKFNIDQNEAYLSKGVTGVFKLYEGQGITFVLREVTDPVPGKIDTQIVDSLQKETSGYWFRWISKGKYRGSHREPVERGLLILKMLTFEPTGAIIAAPTFSLPEDIGGPRNWDYRFSWVRDSSFTIYILLRMGFTDEAESYMNFITARLKFSRMADGGLPIMFGIRGETELPELELDHWRGYRDSRPVRIGNGAADHVQLDIYGELMDGIYLYNKYGKPTSWEQWVAVRELCDYVCGIWQEPDMSIWEVRSKKQNFVYSKIMLWVALDRGLRLSEKRCLPCPNRQLWMTTRDRIYEEVMTKGFNKEMNCFIQSYESPDVLDSAVLIAPLVFFISPNDPMFIGTMERILKAPEKGGLTSTGLVYRYNTMLSEDGVGGREGAFSMCTFWLVEALARAGQYDKKYLLKAVTMFEDMLSFSNHLNMFSEEIARSGEQLGNTPQAFSHLAMISAAFNLDRITGGSGFRR